MTRELYDALREELKILLSLKLHPHPDSKCLHVAPGLMANTFDSCRMQPRQSEYMQRISRNKQAS